MTDVAVTGLVYLAKMFAIVDEKFSEIWGNLRVGTKALPEDWPPNTPMWLSSLQQQLTNALPEKLDITEFQVADLRITQQWLRTIVWQLSTASGCLSSTSADETMRLSFPIDVARELTIVTSRLSLPTMEAHGFGLVRFAIRHGTLK